MLLLETVRPMSLHMRVGLGSHITIFECRSFLHVHSSHRACIVHCGPIVTLLLHRLLGLGQPIYTLRPI